MEKGHEGRIKATGKGDARGKGEMKGVNDLGYKEEGSCKGSAT